MACQLLFEKREDEGNIKSHTGTATTAPRSLKPPVFTDIFCRQPAGVLFQNTPVRIRDTGIIPVRENLQDNSVLPLS
jgi:hypothetical protein